MAYSLLSKDTQDSTSSTRAQKEALAKQSVPVEVLISDAQQTAQLSAEKNAYAVSKKEQADRAAEDAAFQLAEAKRLEKERIAAIAAQEVAAAAKKLADDAVSVAIGNSNLALLQIENLKIQLAVAQTANNTAVASGIIQQMQAAQANLKQLSTELTTAQQTAATARRQYNAAVINTNTATKQVYEADKSAAAATKLSTYAKEQSQIANQVATKASTAAIQSQATLAAQTKQTAARDLSLKYLPLPGTTKNVSSLIGQHPEIVKAKKDLDPLFQAVGTSSQAVMDKALGAIDKLKVSNTVYKTIAKVNKIVNEYKKVQRKIDKINNFINLFNQKFGEERFYTGLNVRTNSKSLYLSSISQKLAQKRIDDYNAMIDASKKAREDAANWYANLYKKLYIPPKTPTGLIVEISGGIVQLSKGYIGGKDKLTFETPKTITLLADTINFKEPAAISIATKNIFLPYNDAIASYNFQKSDNLFLIKLESFPWTTNRSLTTSTSISDNNAYSDSEEFAGSGRKDIASTTESSMTVYVAYNQQTIDLSHSHNWEGKDIFSGILGVVNRVGDSAIGIATAESLLGGKLSEIITGKEGKIAGERGQAKINLDIMPLYQQSTQPEAQVSFSLISHKDPWTEVILPAYVLLAKTYPSLEGSSDIITIFQKAVEAISPTSVLFPTTTGPEEVEKQTKLSQAIEAAKKTIRESGKNQTRANTTRPPDTWRVTYLNSTYKLENCICTNVKITFNGPWISTQNSQNIKSFTDIEKIAEGVFGEQSIHIADSSLDKIGKRNTFKGLPSHANITMTFKSNYQYPNRVDILESILSDNIVKVTTQTTAKRISVPENISTKEQEYNNTAAAQAANPSIYSSDSQKMLAERATTVAAISDWNKKAEVLANKVAKDVEVLNRAIRQYNINNNKVISAKSTYDGIQKVIDDLNGQLAALDENPNKLLGETDTEYFERYIGPYAQATVALENALAQSSSAAVAYDNAKDDRSTSQGNVDAAQATYDAAQQDYNNQLADKPTIENSGGYFT